MENDIKKHPDRPKMPGGSIKTRPLLMDGEFYDPLDSPKLYQNPDGTREYRGGKKLDKDDVYSARFWQDQPEGMRQTMIDIIHNAAEKHGFIGSFVSPDGIGEKDKEKLSAYRKLAKELGYELGEYKFNPDSQNVTAPITKKNP